MGKTSLSWFSPFDNRWYAVGGELYGLADVKVVDGLDETHAADLEEVVHVLAASGEFLDDGENEAEVPGDQLFAGGGVAVLCADQKLARLLVLQDGELRRVDAAYLHFALHPQTSLCKG